MYNYLRRSGSWGKIEGINDIDSTCSAYHIFITPTQDLDHLPSKTICSTSYSSVLPHNLKLKAISNRMGAAKTFPICHTWSSLTPTIQTPILSSGGYKKPVQSSSLDPSPAITPRGMKRNPPSIKHQAVTPTDPSHPRKPCTDKPRKPTEYIIHRAFSLNPEEGSYVYRTLDALLVSAPRLRPLGHCPPEG